MTTLPSYPRFRVSGRTWQLYRVMELLSKDNIKCVLADDENSLLIYPINDQEKTKMGLTAGRVGTPLSKIDYIMMDTQTHYIVFNKKIQQSCIAYANANNFNSKFHTASDEAMIIPIEIMHALGYEY